MALPSGYTKLEYIESTGTQYINTGFVPNANTKAEVIYENPSATQGVCVVGSDTTWKSNGFAIYSHLAEFAGSSVQYTLSASKQTVTLDKGNLFVNGSGVGAVVGGTVASGLPLYMFANNRGGEVREFLSGRIYECKVYDNGSLVRNFIPCKASSGVVGMWDDVNSKFYTNAGTGNFMGQLPSGYTEIEYIESTGTQYIDALFKPTNNTRITMDVTPLDVGGGQQGGFFFGSGYPVQQYGFEAYVFNSVFCAVYGGVQSTGSTTIPAGTRLQIDFNKGTCLVNSSDTQIFLTAINSAAFTSSVNLHLLVLPRQSKYYGKCKLYHCQVYDNGVLIRYFTPCKKADGTIGLWDSVYQMFYANAGTGTFNAGEPLVDLAAHKTLVNGTAYTVQGGKCMVDGTVYNILKGRTLIDGTGWDITFPERGTKLSTLDVGQSVFANVGGTKKEFLVVHQGLPSSLYDSSCDGTWLLMKDIYENRAWSNYSSNNYKISAINTYLDGTFIGLFDSGIQNLIKQVKIPYVNGTGGSAVDSGADGLTCRAFLLSGREVGLSGMSDVPSDGAKLGYFDNNTGADTKRVAYLNGGALGWALRSAVSSTSNTIWFINVRGMPFNYQSYANGSYGIRPCIILPSDALVDDEFNLIA